MDSKTEIRQQIGKLFDRISPKYDLVNRILSLGLDIRWRRRVCDFMPSYPKIKLLDLATGTADQIISAFRKSPLIERAIGVDLSTEMLKVGQQKISRHSYANLVKLMEGDATKLPFDGSIADVITMSFGIRNVLSPIDCMKEMHRLLTPGGRALILEFSLPRNRLIKSCHLIYLRHILPFIGGLISRNRKAYRYLNETIETFPYGEEFGQLLHKAGFTSVEIKPLTFGIVTLYIAHRDK